MDENQTTKPAFSNFCNTLTMVFIFLAIFCFLVVAFIKIKSIFFSKEQIVVDNGNPNFMSLDEQLYNLKKKDKLTLDIKTLEEIDNINVLEKRLTEFEEKDKTDEPTKFTFDLTKISEEPKDTIKDEVGVIVEEIDTAEK